MKQAFLLAVLCFGPWGSAFATELGQPLFDKGKVVFEQYCMACHTYGPPQAQAPHMLDIAKHYHQTFTDRDQAIAHMIDFVKQPSPDKSRLMSTANQASGMMPAMPLPTDELQAVAYWTWEIYNQEKEEQPDSQSAEAQDPQ